MGAPDRLRSSFAVLTGRTFAVCLALSAFLWLLRTLEGDRTVTCDFAIELVGAEASTGLQALLLDSTAKAEVTLSPWDHLVARWTLSPKPVRLKVEGLRTPRTEVPSGQLAAELEDRLGKSARVRSITPATLAIDVRRKPRTP